MPPSKGKVRKGKYKSLSKDVQGAPVIPPLTSPEGTSTSLRNKRAKTGTCDVEPLQNNERMRAPSSSGSSHLPHATHAMHTNAYQDVEHDGRTSGQQEHDGRISEQQEHTGRTLSQEYNEDRSYQFVSNVGSSGIGSRATCKPFVLPSHLRRSARASRSKYRRVTEQAMPSTSDNEVEAPEEMMENDDATRVPQSVRRFTKEVRRSHNPASCRPELGAPPFPLYWVKGVPVGPHAVQFGDYCGEEARRYDRYPLHRRWDFKQEDYARSLYRTALIKKHYVHLGEEDPENEGEWFLADQRAAEKFIYMAIQDIKKDWRHTIKKEYFNPWEEADDETRVAILEGLDPRIPKDKWPTLCAYYSSPAKKAEAERNAKNRRSDNKLRPTCTTGRKRLMNVYWSMKKAQGPQFRISKAFIHGHTRPGTENVYPDDDTRQYCEQMEEMAENMPLESQSNFSSLCSLTDAISGGHHGGYERGLGRTYSRRLQKAAEKSPMIRIGTSQQKSQEKSQDMIDLENKIKELEKREQEREQEREREREREREWERERERQQAMLNEQIFPFASGQTVDVTTFVYVTTFVSMMVQRALQMGVTFNGMTNFGQRSYGEHNDPSGSGGNALSRPVGGGGSSNQRQNEDQERRSST